MRKQSGFAVSEVEHLRARLKEVEREMAHYKASDALPDESWQESLDRALRERDEAYAMVAALREALDHLLREWLAWNPGITGLARTRADKILADTATVAAEYRNRIYREGQLAMRERAAGMLEDAEFMAAPSRVRALEPESYPEKP